MGQSHGLLPDLPIMTDTAEFPARKRRTSHDERIVAKQRTFLIDVEDTKSSLIRLIQFGLD